MIKKIISFGSFVVSFALSFLGCGGETKLKVGDKAPEFVLKNANKENIKLSSFKGQIVVLYFYPKDNTQGCTVQACSFRDSYQSFQEIGVKVLGVSVDDIASHKKFKQDHNLNFSLLADQNKEISKLYGTLNNLGFSSRTTFLIDKSGRIAKIYKNVVPEGHAKKILNDIKPLL